MTTALLTFGYPGSGKGTALEIAQNQNIPTITMGDIVRTNAKRAYSITGEPTELDSLDNNIVGPYATTMRDIHGDDVMARLTIDEINSTDLGESDRIVIDGLRSVAELNIMRNAFESVTSVYIHASRETRLERLRSRGRDEKEKELIMADLIERDEREESWGLDEVVENTHYTTRINNEDSLETFKQTFKDILKHTFIGLNEQE